MLLFSPPFFFLLTDVQEKSETFRPLLILAECTGIRYSSFFAKCSWLERGKKRIYICWKISESFRQDLIPQISCSLFLSSWVGAACINPFIAKGSSSSCIQFPWGMKGHFILLRWWSGNSLLQLVQWLLASVFPSDYLCVCVRPDLSTRVASLLVCGLGPQQLIQKTLLLGGLRLESAQLMSQALFALAAWCNERPLVFLSSLCFFSKVFCPCSSYHHTC